MKKVLILTVVISTILTGTACAKHDLTKTEQAQINENITQNRTDLTIFSCDLKNNNKIVLYFNKNEKIYKYTIQDTTNKITTFSVNEDEVEPPHYYTDGDTGKTGFEIISYNKNFDAHIKEDAKSKMVYVDVPTLNNYSSQCKKNSVFFMINN